jgi:MarR family transcriptional regulator for hemolysin
MKKARAGVRSKSPAIPQRGIGGLLHEGERAFKAELQRRLAEFGLPVSHWFHLSQLWAQDGLTQVELSRRLGLEKASTTAVLDSLQKRGLIRRAPRQEDRRKIDLYLTPAGRRLTEKLIACAVAVNATARRGLPDRQVAIFLEVLHTMIANLRASAGDAPAAEPLRRRRS